MFFEVATDQLQVEGKGKKASPIVIQYFLGDGVARMAIDMAGRIVCVEIGGPPTS